MRHGIGIVDHIEDRIVGLKVRDIYEVPAAAILLKAHRELERLTGTIHQNQFKPRLDQQWAYLVYAGLWWEPLRTDLEAYIRHVNERVTGDDRAQALQGLGPRGDAREPERGLRRPARDLRRVRRSVLPAGVARVHRDLVAAVPDGTPAPEPVEPRNALQAPRHAGLERWQGAAAPEVRTDVRAQLGPGGRRGGGGRWDRARGPGREAQRVRTSSADRRRGLERLAAVAESPPPFPPCPASP